MNKRLGIWLLLILAVFTISVVPVRASVNPAGFESSSPWDMPDEPPAQIDDPISDAELQDLENIASQSGISLRAAIDRYAWNDNFALMVASIRETSPEAFARAKIVDAENAWVAFKDGAPQTARAMVDNFEKSNSDISIEMRTDAGFTALELETAIPKIHYAILARPEVRSASTSFDFGQGQIATTVLLKDTVSDDAMDNLRAVAEQTLNDPTTPDISDKIGVELTRSTAAVLGGDDSGSEHLGGEALSSCTSGFGTIKSNGVTGISTAGHCGDSQSDDGSALTFKDGHEGQHGDFQWHTGSQNEPDDFYAGSQSATEVNRRDVSSIGFPVVGQSLCRNGKTSNADCQEVRKLDVCYGGECNLVQMGEHQSDGGDSGGAVYWGNQAYGLHKGWMYDPAWPADRDLFSRADRIDNALPDVFINS